MGDRIDVLKIRRMRAELRACLPAFERGRMDNETLSACLALLAEAGAIRVLGSTQGLDAVDVMREISTELSRALKTALLRYLPEAVVFELFQAPGAPSDGKATS